MISYVMALPFSSSNKIGLEVWISKPKTMRELGSA